MSEPTSRPPTDAEASAYQLGIAEGFERAAEVIMADQSIGRPIASSLAHLNRLREGARMLADRGKP